MLHDFIWQHPNWTEGLTWDAEALIEPLTASRRQQGRLLARDEGLGMDLGVKLRLSSMVDEAMNTSSIEGERLDRDSVRSSVARRLGVSAAALKESGRSVDGLVELLMDATSEVHRPLTVDRLLGWHAGLFPTGFSGICRIEAGRWREGAAPMRVVSGGPGRGVIHFEGPPSQSVPVEIERLLQWWAAPAPSLDGFLRAGIAHIWFLTIHPFEDGNGRIGRALADLALAQDEGSQTRLWTISPQIQAERSRYYAEIEGAQRGAGDLTPWLAWFLGCVGRALERAEAEVDRVLARSRFWERCGPLPLSARQLKVIRRLLEAGPEGFEGGLTSRKYVAITRVSPATAGRDLAELVERGVLVRRPGAGRSTSYALRW